MILRIRSDTFADNSWVVGLCNGVVLCYLQSRNRIFKYDLVYRKASKGIQKRHPLVRFEVVMTLAINSTIFWDMSPRSLVEVFRSFGGTYCIHLRSRSVSRILFSDCSLGLFFITEDKGGVFLRNLGKPLPVPVASLSRRQNSSYTDLPAGAWRGIVQSL
jgi:hypothetical protein